MTALYLYKKKIRITPGVKQEEHFDDFMVGDQRSSLNVNVPLWWLGGTFRITWTPITCTNIIAEVEWRVLILNEDWSIRREGSVVRCDTRERESENEIDVYFDDKETGYLYFGIELKVINTIPTIGNIEHFPADGMKITLGKNKQKCLHLTQSVVDDFPAQLKRLLAEKRHLHIDSFDEKFLIAFATLDTDSTWMVRMIKQHCHEEMIRRLTLLIKYRPKESVDICSPLIFLCVNFKNMKKCLSEKQYVAIDSPYFSSNSKCKTIEFEKPEGVDNWLDAINKNRGIVHQGIQGKWILGLSSTIYNKVPYCSFSLTTMNDLFFTHNLTLELKGSRKDCKHKRQKCSKLKFHLSPHGFEAQSTYSTPVLCKMAKLERIGMGHEEATVVLKIRNKGRQNRSLNIANFLGIKNYTIVSGDKIIRLNREVLQASSDYFAALDAGFKESKKGTVTLEGDDPDALILLFKIVYGSGAPLTYELLGKLLVLADKYAFVDVLRYLDAFVADLAKESRLPQPWADKIDEITKFLKLQDLKEYLAHIGTYRSSLTTEESHEELLYQLGIPLPDNAKVEEVDNEEKTVPDAHCTRKRRRTD